MSGGANHPQQHAIIEAAQALLSSRKLVVLTGAGISKESGIPTFREATDGLWSNFNPDEFATPRAFRRDPKKVWDWYEYRRGMLGQAKPNPGHEAIAAMEKLLPHLVVITQNIDGLHTLAGSSDVIALHGDMRLNKCFNDCQGNPTYIDVSVLTDWDREAGPPRCPYCGAYVRPDVVWFEEMLPPDALERAYDLCAGADLALVVGTSGVVQPAASLPFVVVHHGGAVIEVNPEFTTITTIAKWHLSGPSGDILPRILAVMQSERPHEQ